MFTKIVLPNAVLLVHGAVLEAAALENYAKCLFSKKNLWYYKNLIEIRYLKLLMFPKQPLVTIL